MAFGGLISKSSLKELAGEKYFERGLDYFESGAVVYLRFGEDGISARIQGGALSLRGAFLDGKTRNAVGLYLLARC